MERPAKICAVVSLISCICIPASNAQQYSPLDLYKLEDTPILFGGSYDIESASKGQVAGARVFVGPVNVSATMWNGPSGAVTFLAPTGGGDFSHVHATDGVHQVGFAYGPQGDNTHAVIWNGTANSVVDLYPTKLPGVMTSEALGMGGGQQVGFTSTFYTASGARAVLWQGTADSAVDLHPTNLSGFKESIAYGTDGARQVGTAGVDYGSLYSGKTHALLWSGTADSAIDLHPAQLGFDTSKAVAILGTQQVGSGSGPGTAGKEHALLWFGSAASAIDLNPTLLTYIGSSTVRDTNGTVQVGSGGNNVSNRTTALLWSGSSDSAIDLGALLPANLTASIAYSVDPDGTVWGIAFDVDRSIHAIEWTLVPEPSTLTTAAVAVLSFALCKCRRPLLQFRPI